MAGSVSRRRRWVAVGLVICGVLVLACLLVFLPNPAVMRSRTIHTVVQSSVSMLPTIGPGDWLVIVPGRSIRRGDVVVHAAPPGARSADPLLKRVVALAGDTVEVRNGRLFLNGAAVSGEPLPGTCTLAHVWKPGTPGAREAAYCEERIETIGEVTFHVYCTKGIPCGDVEAQRVPPGRVFVLGDFRDHSADSRVYGPIAEDQILGRASWYLISRDRSGVRWDRFGRPVK